MVDRERGGAEPGDDGLGERIAEAGRRMELANPDLHLPRPDRIVNRCVELVGVTVLSTIVGVIFANAFGRYAFNVNLIWAEELVLLLVPWLAMTGVFLAVRRGTMIRIEYFFEKLPGRFKRGVASAGHVASIAVLVFMGWISVNYVMLFGGDETAYLQAPKSVATVALAFGGFGAALAFVAEFYREHRAWTADRADPPPGMK